jgi:hypothetical protein
VDINNIGKKILSSYTSVEPTYKDDNYKAVESRELIEYGILEGSKTATYNLKLWMDESVTIDDDAMNKIFASKISVVASKGDYNPVLAKAIVNLAMTDTTNLVYDDGTNDHNTRYIGADPDNYLCFDRNCTNGKWRVIGVMNNMETATNGTQSLVKIIRANSIGYYAWDENKVNDWTTSTLQAYLNSGDWWAKNLSDYGSLLEIVTWNLGGTNTNALVAGEFYNSERGTSAYSSSRPTTWSGKIGLMYPSDYGYATSGGTTTDRVTCLATNLGSWSDSDVSDCKNNDYLYLKSIEWTITRNTANSGYVLDVNSGRVGSCGSYCGWYANKSFVVRPVGYLISSTEILSGNGTSLSPWIIGA